MSSLETVLQEAIRYSQEHLLFSNAVFLAERLYAYAPTETSLALLARCHLESSRPGRAFELLNARQPLVTDDCRYLLGLCCFKLGRLSEAERALQAPDLDRVPNGAAGLHLLAHILRFLPYPAFLWCLSQCAYKPSLVV